MLAHVETMPRPPHELEPSIPKQLSDIIRKGLEKAPENRHQSAMAFLQAIAELVDLPARPVVRKQPTDALGAQSRFGKQGPGQVINRGETSTNSQEFDDRAESRPHDILPRFLAKVGAKLLRPLSVVAPAAAILVALGLWAAYSPVPEPSSRGIAPEAGSIDLDLSALELPVSTATSSGRHELMRRIDPGSVITVLAISADGSRFAGIGETKAIDVWDAYRGERVASLPSEVTPQGLTISSDGELVAMAYSDGRILLWEASGFGSVEIDGKGPVEAIVFSDDNHLLAVAYPESFDIWDVSDRSRPRQTQHHQLGAQALAFSPSGTTVALASTADSVELVALDTRAKRRTIGVDPGVSTLSFSADGILLAAAGKYGIKVWERDTKESLTSLVPGRYLTVTITPFGRCVALALEDKMAQIWDATVDEQLSTFRHSYKLTAAALSRDGQVAVTASLAGDLWIWRAPAGWDRPQPSESLLKRASHPSNNASGDRRAKTTLRRSDSVASHRSSPEQSNFPVLNAKDKEAAIAPPREQPPEDTRGTSERADSEEATAADPQNERAGDGTDQKENPEEKKRNIFRRAIGIFR
jgi:WD40 repeat protein